MAHRPTNASLREVSRKAATSFAMQNIAVARDRVTEGACANLEIPYTFIYALSFSRFATGQIVKQVQRQKMLQKAKATPSIF